MNICFCGVPCDSVAIIRSIITEEFFTDANFEYLQTAESIKSGDTYDAVFLYTDIGCIDAGKRINALLPHSFLLFISDNDRYAVQAYECGTFHYLLKNDSRERYLSALTRLYKAYILSNRKYLITCKQGTICTDIFDIDYIECRMKYTVFHIGQLEYAVRQPISVVVGDLKPLFIQVHQGFAVNPLKIQKILKNEIILTDGTSIMMSVRKRKETIELFKKRTEIFLK